MQGEHSKQSSFFGMIYEDLIPADHLLRKLSAAVDFSFVSELVSDCYCPDNGRSSWNPLVLFKVVFLQFLYDLSDREIEEQVNLDLACKWFAGLGPEERAPDHSTLCRFRSRLGPEKSQQTFNEISGQANSRSQRERANIANGLGVVVNPLVAKLYDTERARGINLLHAFQGVGRLLAPMLVAACIGLGGQWRTAFVVSAILFGIWFVLVWFGLKETPQQVGNPQEHGSSFDVVGALRDRVVVLGIAGFFFLAGCELNLMTWLPNFLKSETHFGKTDALTALTAMMIGYTAIRLVLGVRRLRFAGSHIAASAIVLAAAFWLVTKVGDRYLLYSVALLMGLCFGPYWPSLAAAVYDHAPSGHGTLTGLFNVGGTACAFVFVSAVGVLGDIVGLRHALLIAPVCGILFAIAYCTCEVLARRNRPRIAASRDA